MTCENCKYYDVDYERGDDYEEEIKIYVCRKGHDIDFALRNICSDFKKYKPKKYIERDTIEQALDSCTSGIGNVVFWVFCVALTIGVVIGFCYLDNKWLED